jgi:hypothetical protein
MVVELTVQLTASEETRTVSASESTSVRPEHADRASAATRSDDCRYRVVKVSAA